MKKEIGLFEAKTRLSEICAKVHETGEAVTITKRGRPLVVITPARTEAPSIKERLARYRERFADSEEPEDEFVLPQRSRHRVQSAG
ncbi:MAG: type II toxin-antitoxin system Phd/YefM family antitoxin [Candidatus Eremiobacteraeota bacterium]|nr:type II toxin-antitoxin system Phd/YefM family antitoxin [Candidatus Eremiobacteraeota bacterium]